MKITKNNQRDLFFDEIASALSIQGLEPDAFDGCALLIDGKIEIYLQREEDGSCLMHGAIAILPDLKDTALLTKLLEANLFWFWGKDEHVTLSLDAASSTVFAAQRLPAEEIQVSKLRELLDNFVGAIEFWQKEINKQNT